MTTVTDPVAQTPTPGTPEHDAAMAAKYQTAQTPASEPAPAEPAAELIAGKYKSVDDLVTAYKALESKLGAAPKAEPAATPEVTPPAPEGEPKAAPVDTPAADTVFAKAAAAFEADGDIPAELRTELAKVGIDDAMVNTYLEGVRASTEKVQAEAHTLAGGTDKFTAMQKWIATLPESEIAAYNAAVTDPNAWRLAIQGMAAKFTAANGNEGGLLTNESATNGSSGDVFRSRAEVTAAMADPRYAKDAAYRELVASKMKSSRAAGTLPSFNAQIGV